MTIRRMDVLLLCQFATWTFRTFGCFYIRTFRYLPGRFATCLKACKNFSEYFFLYLIKGIYYTSHCKFNATALQTASVCCTNLNEQHNATFCNRNALLKVQFGNYGR